MTDWVMPEMDGIESCKALRRNPDWRNIELEHEREQLQKFSSEPALSNQRLQ